MRCLIVEINTDVEEISIEELILAKAQLKTIDDGYQDMKLDSPDWVIDKLSEVDREITMRVRSELMARLKRVKGQRAALRTADEKRTALDAEASALEEMLK